MRFYVAAKFERYAEVRRMIDYLKRHGHECTYDWTRTDEFDWRGEPIQVDPHELPKEQLTYYAEKDIEGVLKADFFVLLADHEALNGALVEMGAALASSKAPIIYVLSHVRWNIFMEMDQVRTLSIESFVEQVKEGL